MYANGLRDRLLRAGLHQLDQVQEEDISILITEPIDRVGYYAGVMQDCETVTGVLEMGVLLSRSRQFLRDGNLLYVIYVR